MWYAINWLSSVSMLNKTDAYIRLYKESKELIIGEAIKLFHFNE